MIIGKKRPDKNKKVLRWKTEDLENVRDKKNVKKPILDRSRCVQRMSSPSDF